MIVVSSLSRHCFVLGTLYSTSSLVMLFMFLLLALTNSYNEGLDNKVIGGVYVITGSCLGFLLCRVSLSLNNNYDSGLNNKVIINM